MFEPAGIGEQALFREAWSVAHIVKYAHERLAELGEIELPDAIRNKVLLEIETCGADGLRFRSNLPRANSGGWIAVPAFRVSSLKDTAGAGDWCSAGLLDVLARKGFVALKRLSARRLRYAMEYGQALAAWNCGFQGARGGMYQQHRTQFDIAIKRILSGTERPIQKAPSEKDLSQYRLPELCRVCNESFGNGRRTGKVRKGERRRAVR
jgi:fructokinase